MMAMLLAGFLVMGFLPPPDPRLTGAEVVALFTTDQLRIQLGGLLMILGSALLFPWVAVISAQLRRVEGQQVMTFLQLGSGAVGAMLFVTPMIVVEALAYRPQLLAPSAALPLYYLIWLFFVGTPMFAVIQNAAIGLAVLRDIAADPVFPRWSGYFNLWCAVLFMPGVCVYFFQTGPLSWRGLFTWWIPLTVFGIWFVVMVVLLLRAIVHQERRATEPIMVGGGRV
jgi:hypothetical protein